MTATQSARFLSAMGAVRLLAQIALGLAVTSACAPLDDSEESEEYTEFDAPVTESSLGMMVEAETGGEPASAVDKAPLRETQALNLKDKDDFRVMTLNVYVKFDGKGQMGNLFERAALIRQVLEKYKPDLLGLQEVESDLWPILESIIDDDDGGPLDYRWVISPRGGSGGSRNEALVMLVKDDRFEIRDYASKTITNTARRKQGGCKSWIGTSHRTVQRVKVIDRKTARTIDAFNTHFPTGDDCEQLGMSILTYDYVHAFGDNVVLMGDFNTGYEQSGMYEFPMVALVPTPYQSALFPSGPSLPTPYLTETHRYYKNIQSSGEDKRGEHGRSFITDKADSPERRLGRKIDHVLVAPAFAISKTGIDRSLFLGNERFPCGDSEAQSRIGTNHDRLLCNVYSSWVPTALMRSYSDHWAVWADIARTDCIKSDCAATPNAR